MLMNGSRINLWPSENNKAATAWRQVHADWHFLLFSPVVTSVPKDSVVMPPLVGLLSRHSPEKSCRSSLGCRRRPLRHDSGGCQMRQTTKAEVRLE